MKSYYVWLETAYTMFATEGPENFSVKSLSQHCGLPRTNFYYHFENKDELIDSIIELHFKTTTEQFNIELEKRLNNFIPDLYSVIYDFKIGIQFARTLFKLRDKPKFNEAYKKGIDISAGLIVPKFKDYFNINLDDSEVKELYCTLVDTWFSRLKFDNFTVKYMCDLAQEIMETIQPLIKSTANQLLIK